MHKNQSYMEMAPQQSYSYSLAGARVHTKQTLRVPFQYKLASPNDRFIFSFSCLPTPRLELRTLAGYNCFYFHEWGSPILTVYLLTCTRRSHLLNYSLQNFLRILYFLLKSVRPAITPLCHCLNKKMIRQENCVLRNNINCLLFPLS